MNSKTYVLILTLMTLTVSSDAFANDFKNLVNKAVDQGKKELVKQAGKAASSKAPGSASTPATPANQATPSTAATQANPGTPGTAVTPTSSATQAIQGTPGATVTPAAPATPAAPKSLSDKLKEAATKEGNRAIQKYGKKYGEKYLKRGTDQINKITK